MAAEGDTAHGGDGRGRIYGQDRSDAIQTGNDRLYAKAGDDRLVGGTDTDICSGSTGVDTVSGGNGIDTTERTCETVTGAP